MTSMFLIRAVGIRLTSTEPSEFDGTTRRPFIRTSVRFEPRLRRLMLAWPPLDGLFEVDEIDGVNCGRSLIKVSIVTEPVAWKSWAVTVTIGLVER